MLQPIVIIKSVVGFLLYFIDVLYVGVFMDLIF